MATKIIGLLLILSSLQTLSLAQGTYTNVPDTICYNMPDLERIALRVTRALECDSLLKISNIENSRKDTIILNDSIQKRDLAQVSLIKDLQISNRDNQIQDLNTRLKTAQLGFWGTLAAFIAYLILHK